MTTLDVTKTVAGGTLRLIKSDTGMSLYLVGDTKPVKEEIKALRDLAFPPRWNSKKQAWNIVPNKNSMASVIDQLRHLFAVQAQQADQMPEVSGSVAWVQPASHKINAASKMHVQSHSANMTGTLHIAPSVTIHAASAPAPSFSAPAPAYAPSYAPICKGIKVNGEPCRFKAKYGNYCGHHRIN